jgi:hypothetical protein
MRLRKEGVRAAGRRFAGRRLAVVLATAGLVGLSLASGAVAASPANAAAHYTLEAYAHTGGNPVSQIDPRGLRLTPDVCVDPACGGGPPPPPPGGVYQLKDPKSKELYYGESSNLEERLARWKKKLPAFGQRVVMRTAGGTDTRLGIEQILYEAARQWVKDHPGWKVINGKSPIGKKNPDLEKDLKDGAKAIKEGKISTGNSDDLDAPKASEYDIPEGLAQAAEAIAVETLGGKKCETVPACA